MNVIASFPVNLGRWLNPHRDRMPFDKGKWASLHFAEIVLNPSDFPQPLFGKLLAECASIEQVRMSSRYGNGWIGTGQIRGAYCSNRIHGKLIPIPKSEIAIPQRQWTLVESVWFPFPKIGVPILFWIQSKHASVALFTLLFGVSE